MQGTSPAGVQGERCPGDSVKGPLCLSLFPKEVGWLCIRKAFIHESAK
jgi:hypothetical protein